MVILLGEIQIAPTRGLKHEGLHLRKACDAFQLHLSIFDDIFNSPIGRFTLKGKLIVGVWQL